MLHKEHEKKYQWFGNVFEVSANKSIKLHMKSNQFYFNSVFGIPITLEENDSDSIVDYLLEMAVTGNPPDVDQDLYIPNDDMKYLLYFIGSIAIEMSKEAEDLLKSYFLATRSLRPG